MSFWTQLFFILIIFALVTWFARARLLAVFVSWLATRQKGLNVKVESLTLGGATQVLVTMGDGRGLVKDVQCRRVKIGWMNSSRSEMDRSPSSEGGSDGEDDSSGGSGSSGLPRLLASLSRLRVHIQLVGVRVRLRCERILADEGNEGAVMGAATRPAKAVPKTARVDAGFLLKSVLPFISVDVHDVEISSYGAESVTTLFKGKRLGVELRRSDQTMIVEHVFVCPGARGFKDDKIYHECGLVEVDSACMTSATSLHDLLRNIRTIRRKRAFGARLQRISVDVRSLRMNVDPLYLNQLKAVFGGSSKSKMAGVAPNRQLSPAMSLIHRICGAEALPLTIDTAIRSVEAQIPRAGCMHHIDLKGVSTSCQVSPMKPDARHGRVESSLSWDNVSVAIGSHDAVAVACQSSRTESTLQLQVPSLGDEAVHIDGGIDVCALHTKVHHEHIGAWLEALQMVEHEGGSDDEMPTVEGSTNAKQRSISQFNLKLYLGNGSSMQFVDSDGVCMLHQSLDAASMTVRRSNALSEAKVEVSGVAMAEETQDSRFEGQLEGGVQRLRQVLSNKSFSSGLVVDEKGDTAVSVTVNSLAGKVSNKLMNNVCKIAGTILQAISRMQKVTGPVMGVEGANAIKTDGRDAGPALDTISGAQTDDTSASRRGFSLRVDLLDVDLALFSTYIVEKQHSSVHANQTVQSALALRVRNVGLSRATTGSYKVNSEPIRVSYYEGMSEEDFSLDFDDMNVSVHSTPLIVEGIQLNDCVSLSGAAGSDNIKRRIAVGPVKAHADVDALISIVHFSKSLNELRLAKSSPDRARKKSTTSLEINTLVAVEEVQLCIPVSSDREMSFHVVDCSIEHGDGATSVHVADASMLIKGVETLVTHGIRICVSKKGADPIVIASVHADDAAFLLPHDRDPGPTFKIFVTYLKACKQLMAEIKTSPISPTTEKEGGSEPSESPLQQEQALKLERTRKTQLEITASVSSGKLIFQHHPLERWFASHGQSIRHAALVEHLWDEAHTSVMSESNAPLTPLHSGTSQSERKVKSAGHIIKSVEQPKSWRNLMSRHATLHIKQLSAENKALSLYGDLFQVDFQDVHLHAFSDTTAEESLSFVHAVDEPSRHVVMRSSMLFETEASAARVDVKFGGCNRPLYAGTGLVVQGKVALAKQATASPEMSGRIVHIGMHHLKDISVPLRGTCPPMKVFTDIFVQTETSSVFFSPGMEPVLGLMGITSKRLVPSDPELISKKPPPVPWWDDLRYFWRGQAQISSKALSVILLPGISPVYSKVSERLEIESEDVSVSLKSGEISLESGLLRVLAFRKTLEENGGQLCVFPVADVKSMTASILISWRLSNGADPNNHYVFTSSHADDANTAKKQGPVFVADVYNASALDVTIDISFQRKSEGLDPPMLYIGGEIVSFWRKFMGDWEIPTYVKNQVRRGTFFVRKPNISAKKKGLPKLLEDLKVNICSEELQLTHFTLDGKDPGGGLLMGTTCGRWEFAWECNREIKSFLSPPPNASFSSGVSKEAGTKTALGHLAVAMEHVTVKSLQFSSDGEATPPGSIFKQGGLGTELTAASFSSHSPTETVECCPTESHWLAERVTIVKSMSKDADPFGHHQMKPLKVSVEECYFMTDLELRDAIWATVEHLIAAFAPSQRDASSGPLRSAPTQGLQFQRSYSRHSDISNDGEENELLSLLLQQKRAEGSSALASPQGTVELDRHESANAEGDIVPMTASHDDTGSELKYEVEVSNMQLILQRDHEMGTSRGRLLLATKHATLTGATTDAHTITTLDMEDVQAYISLSSADPSAATVWLDIASDTKEFIAPSIEERESVWRRVFNPINMNLRHSKFQGGTLARHQQSFGSPARQGEELLLKIPEIAAVMDGREFEVLIDVVSFLITSGPTVNTCNSVKDLRRDVLDNSKLVNEQMLLELSSRQLSCIRGEAISLLQGMPQCRSSSIWSSSEPLPFSGALRVALELSEMTAEQPSDVLRKYIEQGQEVPQHNTVLLLRWSEEQESLALDDYKLAKARLEETSESLKRQTQVKSASRVLIHLNRVVWQLCDQERIPFVQASIKKAVFDRRRNRDRSGSVRFTIHRLDVLDATGILPEGPATPAGVILTTWNPESSYEREPMLRVISTLGVPTSKYDVFEHLDATLHPLTLHLTEQIATASWEYFFPKEDQKSRQEAFSSSISGKRIAPTMQPSPRNSSFSASDLVSVSASEVSSPLIKQESDVSSRSETLGIARISSPGIKRRDSPIIRRKKSAVRLQKRFKYVKLNRAHMRITYVGKPIGIKDRVLVINSYACENLDGTWRDLLSNVKQKAIFSALFSGLGLQGRKVKELMIGAAPSIKSVELPKSEDEDLANNRGLLAKFGLKHNSGASQRRKADDPETQKKRALFGESILHRLHRRPTSNNSSPRGEERYPSLPADPNAIVRKHAAPLQELQLDQPLPPDDSEDSEDSEDSDMEGSRDPIDVLDIVDVSSSDPAALPLQTSLPGPLGAGLTGDINASVRSSLDAGTSAPAGATAGAGQVAHSTPTAPARYDPRAPPTWNSSSNDQHKAGPMESFRTNIH